MMSRLEEHENAVDKAVAAAKTSQKDETDEYLTLGPRSRQPVHGNPRQVEQEIKTAAPLEDTGEMNYTAERYAATYPEKQLFWQNDNDPSMQRWIDRGAEPVPAQTAKNRQEYPGITVKRDDSRYVVIHGTGVLEGGNVMNTYLFMIDPGVWDYWKLRPDRERNEAIQKRLESGKSGDAETPTYAPNLPTGGVGYEEKQGLPE